MPTPNPDYRDDWQEMLGTARRAFDQLQALPPKRYESLSGVAAAQELILRMKSECLSTFQHPTIQDAAAWLFDTHPVRTDDGQIMYQDTDWGRFTTLEEVRVFWEQAALAARGFSEEKLKPVPRTPYANKICG